MKTYIVTAHEEEYSDRSRTLGVLLNVDDDGKRIDSLLYIFRKGMYIFFNSIIDMNDYLLYADTRTVRAYLKEPDFDEFFDADYINGLFSENLKWTQ